jgi:hypothetical protein
MRGVHLSGLPLSAKVFCTLFLAGIGCGSLAAFAQASTAVGISPSAVKASLAPEMPMTALAHGQMTAEKEIELGQIPSASDRVWMRTPLLIQTSHTHLFGQTLIAGLLALIFAFSGLRESIKCVIGALPFAGTLLDIGGMWGTRFLSPSLSLLVIAGGSLFALGYVLISLLSVHELWFRKETLA